MRQYKGTFLTGLLFMVYAQAALAAGGGISDAEVEKGVLLANAREVWGTDNENLSLRNRQRQRLALDYGFSDSFASGLYVESSQVAHGHTRFNTLIWDNRFELATFEQDGFSGGFRIRYTYQNGRPDNIHFRPLLAKRYGNWELRFNPIFYSDLGADARSGLGLETRWRASYAYLPDHQIGIENFHDMGYFRDMNGFNRQSNELGLVLTGDFTPEWSYETGYARGMTNPSPDHTFKLFITRNF